MAFLFALSCNRPNFRQNSIENIYSNFDTIFTETHFDTLQLFPNIYKELIGISECKPVSIPDSLSLGYLDNADYYSISKFTMDSTRVLMGYLFYKKTEQTDVYPLYLLIFSKKQMKTLYLSEVATFNSLEGAMEILMNSWILDVNDDGAKDVATIISTIDFENPNEYSDNTAGTERYINTYKKGEYIYSYWVDGLLENVELKH